MFPADAPKTLAEARAYRYHQWSGNPKGYPYREGDCAFEVIHKYLFSQCGRKNGHGPENLFCKQHAKLVEKWRKVNLGQ